MIPVLNILLYAIIILVFLIAAIYALKLYKGHFGISAPYFVMASFLLLGATVLFQLSSINILSASQGFLETSEILQILAGAFLIMGLYKIFETRFATETFFEQGGKK